LTTGLRARCDAWSEGLVLVDCDRSEEANDCGGGGGDGDRAGEAAPSTCLAIAELHHARCWVMTGDVGVDAVPHVGSWSVWAMELLGGVAVCLDVGAGFGMLVEVLIDSRPLRIVNGTDRVRGEETVRLVLF
jgi:hypothetical protein